MRIFQSFCKNCGIEFINKTDYQLKPRFHCSLACKQAWQYQNRVKSGYVKKRNDDPEVKLYKTMWAREHPEVGRSYREKNKEEIAKRVKLKGRIPGDYPEEFFSIKYLVRARDKNMCTVCGEKDRSKLVVHHKDRNKQNNDMLNLVTLCRSCHGIEHRDRFLSDRWTFGQVFDFPL